MRKSFKKEAERIEYAAAKDVFELEWEHAMNKYPDHRRGNGTFDHVCRLTCSKAFATVFKQKFLGSYERAYARATDKFMLSKNSALVWKYENEEVYYNRFTNKNCWMDEDFEKLLTKELKSSLKIVHKEIVEMVEEEFFNAFCKKWYNFKDDIHKKMIFCNNRRMKWAWKKLEEIQKTFVDSWTEEEKKEFTKNTLFEIKEIYDQYESDIESAWKDNSMEMDSYYCFTHYILTYPRIDFMDKANARGNDRNEEINLKDNYGRLMENLWLQLDVERKNCACDACACKDYCRIKCKDEKCLPQHPYPMILHKYALEKECEKIKRQRLLKKSYRTCRFCQKDIPKDEFEKVKCKYEHTFTFRHMEPCARKHGFLTRRNYSSNPDNDFEEEPYGEF